MRRALVTVLLFGLLAPAASAHVTVIPATARPGETRALTFRVLNERDDAETVRVELFIPAGVHATAADRPGWTRVESPGKVDWTAGPGAAIGGAGAKDFEVRAGPFPHAARVVFKVLQHYSDGQIVRWIQDPDPGADRPAPYVQLTATGRPEPSGGGSSATGFAILAALLALAAGAAAVLLRRRRR